MSDASTTNARGFCYKECKQRNKQIKKKTRKTKSKKQARRLRKYVYFQIIFVKVRHTPNTRRVYKVKYNTHHGISCYPIRLLFPFYFKSFQNIWTYISSFFWVGLYIQWIFIVLDSTSLLEITPTLNNNALEWTPVTDSLILSGDPALEGAENQKYPNSTYSYLRVAMPGQTKGPSGWISWLWQWSVADA